MKRIGTKIHFFGLELWITLPYVATDSDGEVHEHSEVRPKADKFKGYWKNGLSGRHVAHVDLEGIDWTTTLKHYDLETGKET